MDSRGNIQISTHELLRKGKAAKEERMSKYLESGKKGNYMNIFLLILFSPNSDIWTDLIVHYYPAHLIPPPLSPTTERQLRSQRFALGLGAPWLMAKYARKGAKP